MNSLKKSDKTINWLFLLSAVLAVGIFMACGTIWKPLKENGRMYSQNPSRAVDFYWSGALHGFRNQRREALNAYLVALKYDSTSAQILKAVGRELFLAEKYKKAIGYLERSFKHNETDKENLYYLAEAYYKSGDKRKAIIYFEALNKLDPYNLLVRNTLVALYSSLGELEKLIDLQEKALSISGFRDETVYQLIMLYIYADKVVKAAPLIHQLLEQHPLRADYWRLYGKILEIQKDSSQAIDAYQKSIWLEPDNEKSLKQFFLLSWEKKDWPGLVNVFEKLLAEQPSNEYVRLLLTEVYFYLKKYPGVRHTVHPLLKSSDVKYQAFGYHFLGRVAVIENRIDDAIRHLEGLIKLNGRHVEGGSLLAALYLQQGEYQKVLPLLKSLLRVQANNPKLLSLYGNTLLHFGKSKAALEKLRQAYALDAQDLNTIIALGIVYEQLQMYSELDTLYEAALKNYPENALLLNNYSYSLGERGIRLKAALKMAQQAVGMKSDNGAYWDTVGWIYYKLGVYQKALRCIQKAIFLKENNSEVLEHLGDVYFKLDNLTEARKYWLQALEKEPDNQELKEKLQQ